MRRFAAAFLILTALTAAPAHGGVLDFGAKARKEKEAKEAQAAAKENELKQSADQAQAALKDLEQKYKDLQIDRDNVLAQTKQLVTDQGKMGQIEEQRNQLQAGMKTMMAQKDRLLSENQRMKKELASIVENHDRLKENFQELQVRENAESQEIESLRKQLTGRIEGSAPYMLVQNEARSLRQEKETLLKTVAALDAKLKKALEFIRKIQDRDFKYVQQLERLKSSEGQLKDKTRSLEDANRSLNQTIDHAPDRMQKLARQNETLIKETSAMHYNMGVLFTETGKFDRAVKEFERALELDPNDQKSHYNLGYIFAEQFANPTNAMEHFRRFLELDPNSQQAEAVKSYMMAHHVYQGKSLEKDSGNPF